MRKLPTFFCLSLIYVLLTACGSGSSSPNTPISSSSPPSSLPASSAPSSAEASSVASSITLSSTGSSPSAEASSAPASSADNSSSAAPVVISSVMDDGWRGNGLDNTGITFSGEGVVFSPTADGHGAVIDLLKPIQLESAIIEMVVNVSSEFKISGASLQVFAQIKGGDWAAEWNCWSDNSTLTAATDATLSCTISEDDKRFNQTEYDVQVGVQAKGSTAGTVTIKSLTVTLAAASGSSSSPMSSSSSTSSVYSANVESLHQLADIPIGASVTNTDGPSFNILTNTSEQAVIEKHFNQVTAGNIMKMSYLQPTQGNFTFDNADEFVEYAKSKNITVHGHSLLWHSSYQVPDFMKNWSGSASDFLDAIEDHVTTIVDHFEESGNVVSWDVVNEALNDNAPSNFRTDSTLHQKSGNSSVYIERAFQAARAADSSVALYYNDYNIDQNNAKTTKLIEMITDFQARDIPLDGIGFQMHVFLEYPSIADISAAMKKVVDKNLLVKITELDISINNPYSDSWPSGKIASFTESAALTQKERYCDIVKAYLDTVPEAQRGGITVWGTTDSNTWLNDLHRTAFNNQAIAWPLLFDGNYNDKPALRGFADALAGTACTQ